MTETLGIWRFPELTGNLIARVARDFDFLAPIARRFFGSQSGPQPHAVPTAEQIGLNARSEPILKAITTRTPRYRAILNKSSGDPIYRKPDDASLELVRLGSHSELGL